MNTRALMMGLAFALMWSSAFTSAHIIVSYAPPLTTLAFRFLISGLLGIGIALIMGQNMRLTRAQWRATIIFGICQNGIYLGLNFVAMQTVEASLAAIIASTMPLLVALSGWIIFKERLNKLSIIGLILGVIGVTVIMGTRISGGVDPFGLMMCVIAVIALTIATLLVHGASSGGNVIMIVGLQMLVGSVVLGIAAILFESFTIVWAWQLMTAFTYTTLVPGLAATFIWFTLVNQIGMVRASTFHFLTPFFGVAIAATLLGETIAPRDVIGVGIIMLGILAVQLSKQSSTRPHIIKA